MLPEMRYIENELLPMLREKADKHEKSAQKQLRQRKSCWPISAADISTTAGITGIYISWCPN